MISLYRALVPKIPNITPLNNVFTITHAVAGTVSVTIPAPGFYTTTDIANELAAQLTTATAPDTFTCTFDPKTETFTLTSVGGNNWTIDTTSTFHARGANLFQFTNPAGAVSTRVSTKAGMLYTRYITITSSRLDRYGVAPSLTSAPDIPAADIVAIIDTVDLYNSDGGGR